MATEFPTSSQPTDTPANQALLGGHGVSLLLGNGNGTFKPAQTIVATGNPTFVAVGDFNNDGRLDLAVANGSSLTGTVSILFGNGDGTFQLPLDTLTGGAVSLTAADFNGDGKLDLVVTGTSGGGTGLVLLGRGDGTFTTSFTTPIFSTQVLAADINGDKTLDLVFSGGGGNGTVKLGNGDGTFRDGQANLQGFLNSYATVGDFNGDGRLDLAIITPTFGRGVGNAPPFNSVMMFGMPDGTFGPQFFTNFSGGPSNIVTADFDGDGKLDTGGAGSPYAPFNFFGVTLGNGDGTFRFGAYGFGVQINTIPGSISTPTFAAVGDFDRNGAPDLIVADGNNIQVALNTGGHPPLLAQLTLAEPSVFGGGSAVPQAVAGSVVGGATTVTGTIYLGGPAPAGGVLFTLSSSNPAALFPGGNTVALPAGSQAISFSVSTAAVTASTPVTISASLGVITISSKFTVIPPFTVSSVSVAPASLFGMLGGNPATGTVTLSGPAADGVVISLTNANTAAITMPTSVPVTPGATTVTFPISALLVKADTPVAVSGSLLGTTRSGTVTVRKELATVVVTKALYTVSKSQLDIEATCNDGGYLQVFNANTGTLVGTLTSTGGGKFTGRFSVPGPFTSAAVQSSAGGLTIAPVPQK